MVEVVVVVGGGGETALPSEISSLLPLNNFSWKSFLTKVQKFLVQIRYFAPPKFSLPPKFLLAPKNCSGYVPVSKYSRHSPQCRHSLAWDDKNFTLLRLLKQPVFHFVYCVFTMK